MTKNDWPHLLVSRRALGVAAAVTCLVAATAAPARGSLFEDVAGSWSGSGTVTVAGGDPEPLRCRASYAPTGGGQLHIGLRCASDSYNLQVTSDIVRNGDRVSGNWSEAGSGVSGSVSGGVGATQLDASVSGAGVSARLSLVLRGNTQSVTLSSDGPFSATASVVLRRS